MPVELTTEGAWAVGLSTRTVDGRVLDAFFPTPRVGTGDGGQQLADRAGHGGGSGTVTVADEATVASLGADPVVVTGPDQERGVEVVPVATFIEDLSAPPVDTTDVWLRLHLLSHRLVRPRALNLDGLFGLLNNVVWTSGGPCPVEGFDTTRFRLRAAGRPVHVFGVDKFPRMTDYVLPPGVRVAHADRVRLGAHLAEGTTVMHEGFVNFNAGTLGSSMVEGRISAGVVIGDHTDLGGGASIMGTLSGGGKEMVSVGERCLIGANAGLGIALGDDCTVEAGLYVTAGTRVTTPEGDVVKARDLSGRSGMLFRRNSVSGAVEVLSQTVDWGGLNQALHQNADCQRRGPLGW